MSNRPRVSVIIPCYNEEATIERNALRLLTVLEKCANAFEAILCNDGSHDHTGEIIHNLAQQHKNIQTVSYDTNRGAGYAFRQGLKVAQGDYLIHMDADLAMDPLEVCTKVVKELRDYDIAIASRYKGIPADYPLRRRIPSAVYRLIFRALLGLPIQDAMSGFFGLRRAVLDVIPRLEMDGFEVYLELFLKAHVNGLTINEVPVKFKHQTESGEVSVWATAPKQLMNTLRVWKRYRVANRARQMATDA
jgi:dolichol-phosphate mannosyltransferase